MVPIIGLCWPALQAFSGLGHSLCLEHLALRHQLAVYQRSVPRPRLRSTDRVLWACLSRLWSAGAKPRHRPPHTVIAWQRQRFRDHWQCLSQRGMPGRPSIAKEVRELIQVMCRQIPRGSPRIVESCASWTLMWPNQRWRSIARTAATTVPDMEGLSLKPRAGPGGPRFLHRADGDPHRAVRPGDPGPRATAVVHFNITEHPTARWTAQQVVDVFPWEEAPRHSAARSGPDLWHVVSATGAAYGD